VPKLTQVYVLPSPNEEDIVAEIEFEYSGGAGLVISTELVGNYPVSNFAILPVTLKIFLQKLSGKIFFKCRNTKNLKVKYFQEEEKTELRTRKKNQKENENKVKIPRGSGHGLEIHLGFMNMPTVVLSVGSAIGYRSQLTDIPKITELIVSTFNSILKEHVVLSEDGTGGICFVLSFSRSVQFLSRDKKAAEELMEEEESEEEGESDEEDEVSDEEEAELVEKQQPHQKGNSKQKEPSKRR